MENNDNNYQILDKKPQLNVNSQQEYGNFAQPYNMTHMQPYNMGYPAITYNVSPPQPLTETNLPEEFKPISPWGYLGYNILFSIPLIGTIMLFVYAFGGTSKVNVRNYARSYFCIILLFIAILIFLAATGVLSALFSGKR